MAFDMSRRLFLRGAAIVAPVLAIPATAALASSYAEENANLLALEPELETAIRESAAASAAYKNARRIGRERWPRAPQAIHGTDWMDARHCESEITGNCFHPLQPIRKAKTLKLSLDSLMRKRKNTLEIEEARRHAREVFEIAQAYEAECEAIKNAVGYDAALERDQAAQAVLLSIVSRIQAEPCQTMAGIRLKAKALEAWGMHGGHLAMLNLEGRQHWMPDFCRALVEIMEA